MVIFSWKLEFRHWPQILPSIFLKMTGLFHSFFEKISSGAQVWVTVVCVSVFISTENGDPWAVGLVELTTQLRQCLFSSSLHTSVHSRGASLTLPVLSHRMLRRCAFPSILLSFVPVFTPAIIRQTVRTLHCLGCFKLRVYSPNYGVLQGPHIRLLMPSQCSVHCAHVCSQYTTPSCPVNPGWVKLMNASPIHWVIWGIFLLSWIIRKATSPKTVNILISLFL